MSVSPVNPKTVCGLDIGSNTFSFVELKQANCDITIENDCSLAVRLSEDLLPAGPLKPAAVMRGLKALESLVKDFDIKNKPLCAMATEALRKTSNPEVFLEPAQEIIGTDIEVIPAVKEAELTAKGATLGLKNSSWIVLDIGGQSTELSYWDEKDTWQVACLDFGVVGLTDRFIGNDPPTPKEMDALAVHVRHALSQLVPQNLKGKLLSVAGTPTSLAMLILNLKTWQRDKVHTLPISLNQTRQWQQKVLACTSAERIDKLGIRPVRADVFPAGLCILEEVMTSLGQDRFIVSANGLRVGIALSLLDRP